MAQVFSEVQPDSPEPLDGVGYNTSVPSDPDVEPHAIMELPDGYVDSRSQRRFSFLILLRIAFYPRNLGVPCCFA